VGEEGGAWSRAPESISWVLSPICLGSLSSTQSNTTQATCFPRFAKLPAEIQLQIWEFTLCPRLITIEIIIYYRTGSRHVSLRASIHTILHACHASRKLGLKYYKLVSDKNLKPFEITSLPRKKRLVYVYLDRDFFTTTLDIPCFARRAPKDVLNRIRYFVHRPFPG
jgi:hypothetical protein